MSENEVLERRFIAKVIYRLGGRKVTETFVEAKMLGCNADMFADPTCKVFWLAAEALFSEPGFEKVSLTNIVIKAKQIIKKTKDKDLQSATPSQEFLSEAEKGVRGDDDISGYYTLLRNAWVLRASEEVHQKAKDAIAAGEDALEVLAQEQSAINEIIKGGMKKTGGVSIRDTCRQIIADYRDVSPPKVELGEKDYRVGIAMPFKRFDECVGGLENSMMVVAARTAVGKTSFAMALLRYWLRTGKKVLFNSLDMEARQAVMRQIAEGSGVSARQLKRGDVDPKYWEDTIAKVERAADELGQYEDNGFYRMEEERNVDSLKSLVKILKDQDKVDIVVVDYIQLMGFKGSQNLPTPQRVSYVSQQLMSIANELKVPVVALAQINRAAMNDDGEPEIHHIKDSGEIEQDASHIIILHPNKSLKKKWEETPPEQFLKDSSRPEAARALMPMWVKVAKSREGDANVKIPFVVLQSRYAWFEGDTGVGVKDDDGFLRVKSNAWKPDPIEKVWEQNGSLITQETMDFMAKVNSQNNQPVQDIFGA